MKNDFLPSMYGKANLVDDDQSPSTLSASADIERGRAQENLIRNLSLTVMQQQAIIDRLDDHIRKLDVRLERVTHAVRSSVSDISQIYASLDKKIDRRDDR